jgi:hypothetical protein
MESVSNQGFGEIQDAVEYILIDSRASGDVVGFFWRFGGVIQGHMRFL